MLLLPIMLLYSLLKILLFYHQTALSKGHIRVVNIVLWCFIATVFIIFRYLLIGINVAIEIVMGHQCVGNTIHHCWPILMSVMAYFLIFFDIQYYSIISKLNYSRAIRIDEVLLCSVLFYYYLWLKMSVSNKMSESNLTVKFVLELYLKHLDMLRI